MSKKIKIFMPCDEANHTCDKSQYKEASLWEMILLNIHLAYCSACRKYTKNNTILTKKMKESKLQTLDVKRKESLKSDFEKALKDNKF